MPAIAAARAPALPRPSLHPNSKRRFSLRPRRSPRPRRPPVAGARRSTARLCYQRKRCSLPRRSRCHWSQPHRSRRPRCVSIRHHRCKARGRAAVSAGRADHSGVVQEPNLNGDYLLSGVGKDVGKTVKNEKFPTHCEEHSPNPSALSLHFRTPPHEPNSHRQTRTTPTAWSTLTSTRL